MIKSDRNIRPEPGRIRRQASTVAELKSHRKQTGAQLRLKCARLDCWYFANDRPHKFGGYIAHRERKGFRVSEAYWLPLGARQWRPISLIDVRRVYRIE